MNDLAVYFAWLAQIYGAHPETPFELQLEPGAGKRELAKASAALGCLLDQELEALWRYAGGSGQSPVLNDGELLASYRLLSIEQALKERGYFAQRAPQYVGKVESAEPRDARVGNGWFSAGWMPFAEIDGGGHVLLVDHQPLGSGRPGQVIRYTHDPDAIDFVANSLAALLPISLAAIEDDPEEFLCIF